MFSRMKNGKPYRKSVTIDCQKAIKDGKEKILTEQNHKGAVDINKIVAKHGIDKIAETTKIQNMVFDDNEYNNFEEMMNMVAKGQQAFMSLPAETRDEFANDPARYMDYVRNPNNKEALIERGWMNPDPVPDAPIEVIVTNPAPETPPNEA